MSRPAINRGKLVWSGERWIVRLREAGADADSGLVSLYHTRYSPAGEGTVAFVDISGEPGFSAVCTDSRELAGWVIDTMIEKKFNPFDRDSLILDAEITRAGDIRKDPSWIIRAEHDRIVAAWIPNQPPVIAEGWAPYFGEGVDFFTLLFFVDEASIVLNGQPIAGQPYPRDVWSKSIGGDRSSCVFALAETKIEVP